jgi:hypothetical protein
VAIIALSNPLPAVFLAAAFGFGAGTAFFDAAFFLAFTAISLSFA